MKTKPADTVYCGVDPWKIEQAHPKLNKTAFKHLLTFIRDRYTVHIKKDVLGLPKPWTDNPILQQYKVTNIRREHDRQSKAYIQGIVKNPDLSLQAKMLNAFMFRAWNNWQTVELFGGPFSVHEIKDLSAMEHAREICNHISNTDPGHLWYNNAYIQGNTKAVWRLPEGKGLLKEVDQTGSEECIPLRMFYFGKYILDHRIIPQIVSSDDQQDACIILRSVPGLSDFLVYQMFVDLTYIPEFPFSENEFTMAGPGCKRGLAHIFTDADGLSPEEQLFWLRDNFDRLNSKFPEIELNLNTLMTDLPEYDRCMNVMSLENCMCELSKYMKVVQGTGRPRMKYKGV